MKIINKSGITIRIPIDELRVMGRATQGVKVINLRYSDAIASVALVKKTENGTGEGDELIVTDNGNGENPENPDNPELG